MIKFKQLNNFTISQLARFSGVKAHTIRAWEQRYNALKPARSEGNTRYYDGAQLRRLLNIVSLLPTHQKVSELCSLPDEKLFGEVRSLLEQQIREAPDEYFIAQLAGSALNYDEASFDKMFAHCLIRYGMEQMYVKILCPFLERIGLMWAGDEIPPAQEHFISNLVRQKLCTAIDALPPPKKHSTTWLLLLPEDEFHEIGLLFAHYIIRLRGHKVIYLGANVPIDSIASAIGNIHPDHLMLFFIRHEHASFHRHYLEKLKKISGNARIYVAAREEIIHPLKKMKGINWLTSVPSLAQELK